MYVIYYNYRVIHISHLIVVVLFKLFAKTEKITMEASCPCSYSPYRIRSIGRAIPQTLISDSSSPAVSTAFHFCTAALVNTIDHLQSSRKSRKLSNSVERL
jgi:hypothetical protein